MASKQLEVIRQFETGNDIRQIVSCSEQGRALKLLKKREEVRAQAEAAKNEIENETRKRKFLKIEEKFAGNTNADFLEEEFKKQTVGLISIDEFKAKRKAIDDIIESATQSGKQAKIRAKRAVKKDVLSFQDDEDADELAESDSDEETATKRKHFGKDPTAHTSFLYDAGRQFDKEKQKQDLIEEYYSMQETMKKEKLEVTYSYWDGSGHRRTTHVEKQFTIGQFLTKAKKELEKTDFPELRSTTLDSLMYVKEDLIIPHNISFYELIKEQKAGKSGPLFHFDVREDLRTGDVRVAKDESHAGKIVDRKWYERNKHIFPASRWEMYDKNKKFQKEDPNAEPKVIQSLRG
jgi:protein FAM50